MDKKKVMKAVKVILIILLVIVLLFLANAFRNFIIVKRLKENVKQYTSSSNYHIKSTSESDKTILDHYKKDDKEVTIMERNSDGKTYKISMYNNGTRKDVFYDNAEGKKVEVNTNLTMEVQVYDYFDMQTDIQLFFSNMFARIKKVDYNGKECYCLSNSFSLTMLWGTEKNEVYIEKDTGLVVKTNIDNMISEREYEFGTVQDEVFVEPDISQYELIKNT